MVVYFLFIEAKPRSDNDESEEFGGAYINCWVKAKSEKAAINEAKNYIDYEGWEIVNIEEISLSSRDWYDDKSDYQICYDSACENGIDAIFNTWQLEEDE